MNVLDVCYLVGNIAFLFVGVVLLAAAFWDPTNYEYLTLLQRFQFMTSAALIFTAVGALQLIRPWWEVSS